MDNKEQKLKVTIAGLPQGNYTPFIVWDSYNNEYVILNKYIAGNLRTLLEACHKLKFPFSSGDWWNDALAYIPEDWQGNTSVENLANNYDLWLEKADKAKHVHTPSKERHAVQLNNWQTIESVKCSKCGVWYKI